MSEKIVFCVKKGDSPDEMLKAVSREAGYDVCLNDCSSCMVTGVGDTYTRYTHKIKTYLDSQQLLN